MLLLGSCQGSLAPESAVLKLSGKDVGPFRGPVSYLAAFYFILSVGGVGEKGRVSF